jgi:thiol-disulfide isomerase/thioredoxin
LNGIAIRLLSSDKVDNVMAAGSLIEGLAQEGAGMSKQERNNLYDRAAAAMIAAAERDPNDEDEMNDRLRSRAKFLTGPAARGELIGGKGPNVEYLWVSDGRSEKSLRDHTGKVVVLDFWATWCGPCIGSFPNVREMQERYKGYDVDIVGVTSLQGKHYGADGPVDVEGKPSEEYKLMQQFMGEKDITWTIAFSKEDVFNPMYGVNGIPHVAILDVDGKVVENGLHPGMDAEHKYEVIDGLLHKAGKKHPEHTKKDAHVPHDHDGDGHPDH